MLYLSLESLVLVWWQLMLELADSEAGHLPRESGSLADDISLNAKENSIHSPPSRPSPPPPFALVLATPQPDYLQSL
jgi:hypothetical protein